MRRRAQLLAQCEAQRAVLAAIARQSESAIKVVDRVALVVNYFRSHPAMIFVAAIPLMVIQRRGLWSWVRRAFTVWRTYRTFRESGFSPTSRPS